MRKTWSSPGEPPVLKGDGGQEPLGGLARSTEKKIITFAHRSSCDIQLRQRALYGKLSNCINRAELPLPPDTHQGSPLPPGRPAWPAPLQGQAPWKQEPGNTWRDKTSRSCHGALDGAIGLYWSSQKRLLRATLVFNFQSVKVTNLKI